MYRSYAQGELPNVGLSLAEVIRPLMALSLRDGSIAASLFGQLVGTLYNARPLATRRRVVVGLENALRSCEESPTHELGSALHQAHAACIDASEKPEDPAVLVPSTSIASTALASNALEPGVLTIEKARLVCTHRFLTKRALGAQGASSAPGYAYKKRSSFLICEGRRGHQRVTR